MTSPIIIRRKESPIQQGLATLVSNLQQAQRARTLEQQVQLQKEQLELQGMAQAGLERQRASQRALQLMQLFGPDVVEDPAVAEQLLKAGIEPKSLQKRHQLETKRVKEQRTNVLKGITATFRDPRAKEVVGTNLEAMMGGAIDEATARQNIRLAMEEIDDEEFETLARAYPIIRKLPRKLAVPAITELVFDRLKQEAGLGPFPPQRESPRIKQARAVIRAMLLERVDQEKGTLTGMDPTLTDLHGVLPGIPARQLQTIFLEERNRTVERLRRPTNDFMSFMQSLMDYAMTQQQQQQQ